MAEGRDQMPEDGSFFKHEDGYSSGEELSASNLSQLDSGNPFQELPTHRNEDLSLVSLAIEGIIKM